MSGDVVPLRQQQTTRVVPISARKPSQEWLGRMVKGLLWNYYLPEADEETIRTGLAMWRATLSDLPEQAVEMAIEQHLKSSTSRPTPAGIRELAEQVVSFRPQRIATDDDGRPFGPDRLPSPEDRERMMAELGKLAAELGQRPDMRPVGQLGRIADVAAEVCGTTPKHVRGVTQQPEALMARWLASRACRQHTAASLAEIGRAIGDRDHSSVSYAIKGAEKRVAEDPAWAEAAAEIDRRLTHTDKLKTKGNR